MHCQLLLPQVLQLQFVLGIVLLFPVAVLQLILGQVELQMQLVLFQQAMQLIRLQEQI